MNFTRRILCLVVFLVMYQAILSADIEMASTVPVWRDSKVPANPNIVLVYYCYDSEGSRDWSVEQLKPYVAYHSLADGSSEARPVAPFFDTFLWMYRLSFRKHHFEYARNYSPAIELDWLDCMNRLFEPEKQLNALEQAALELEKEMGVPVRPWVILTLPCPDTRVTNWSEETPERAWNFRDSEEDRQEAIRWYMDTMLSRWEEAGFSQLRLLGFYWFNETHTNLREASRISDRLPGSDEPLMRYASRYLRTKLVDGRPLTLTWIPYSPYGLNRLDVTRRILEGSKEGGPDYLMIQPNYFFPRHGFSRKDMEKVVRNAASIGAGVEIEFDESLTRDESQRQRFLDYLEAIPQNHPRWNEVPAGYYQGVRALYEMVMREELRPLYDALYEFVRQRQVKAE